jgi:hypothetical protein
VDEERGESVREWDGDIHSSSFYMILAPTMSWLLAHLAALRPCGLASGTPCVPAGALGLKISLAVPKEVNKPVNTI